MKRILLLLSLTLGIHVYSNAQVWTKNLPETKSKSELTFYDYQNAFNEYWEPYNIQKGYYIDSDGEKQKARGYKQFKRWEYFWETQINVETGKFPEQLADEVYKEFNKTSKKSNAKSMGDWESHATNSSDGGYAGIGRLDCIAYHPTDNNTYWVGSPTGGLWVTYDNAKTWESITDENLVLGISDIAIPSDYETSKTIYISTGDRDQWINLSVGVLKSTDAGTTWKSTGLSYALADNKMTTRLLMDPNDDNTLIAATTDGVFKTTDGGTTWDETLTSLSFIDMEYKPGDFSTLYGSTLDGQIYYTNDGGINWNLSLTVDGGERVGLAVSDNDATRVYAVVVDASSGLQGLYKSIDSGATFSLEFNSKNLLNQSSTGALSGGQGWYDLAIAASPLDADILLVGGINSWRSIDGGATFEIVNQWVGTGAQAVHADKHMLSFRENGDIFECNDGGVYISKDTGLSWTDKTNGMTHSQIYRVGVSQHSDNEVVTGLQDNGTKHYGDNTWDDVLGGDGMECLIDYSNEYIQYGCQQRGVIKRTTDGWKSAYSIAPENATSGAWVTPYIMDPVSPSTLYAGYTYLWKTTNKGYSWEKMGTINDSEQFRSLAIAHSNNQVLYAAGLEKIFKTTDGGDSWTNISVGLPSNYITYITVSNNDPELLWVTLGSYDANSIYQSNDGGETWSNISTGIPEIPATCVVQDTNFSDINVLYAGTDLGVYVKIGSQNWQEYNNGLPNVKIGEIEIYYDNDDVTKCRLVAGTYGRGLWKTPLMTSEIGEVELLSVSSITENSALASANITKANDNTNETGFIISPFSGAQLDDKYIKTYTTQPLVTEGEFSVDLTELTNSTYYYIKAYISSVFGTNYSDEMVFATSCNGVVSVLPVVQEFSVDSLPACWDTWDNFSTDMEWVFDNPAGIEFNSSTNSNGFAVMNSEYYGEGKKQSADLSTVHFDFSGYNYVNLIFEHNAALSSGAVAGFYSKNESDTESTLIEQWTDSVAIGSDAGYFMKDISALVSGHNDIVFEWSFQSENAGYWAIDDFLIDSLHAVLVKVTDENSNPISNAEVWLGKTNLTTNFSGEVLFKSVSNTTFDYSVTADGYYESQGDLTMDHSNITLEITPDRILSSNTTLSDITLDGTTIEGFEIGTLNYTITAFDDEDLPIVYAVAEDKNARVGISQATFESPAALIIVTAEDGIKKKYNINFTVEVAPTYNVNFTVTDNNAIPVEEATIAFEEKTGLTYVDGTLTLENVNRVMAGVYTITKENYLVYEDTLSVVDKDVDRSVVMTAVGVNEISLLEAEIYPNPVKDILYYSLNSDKLPVNIKVYNVLGKLVIEKQLTEVSGSIKMNNLESGIYLIQVLVDKQMFAKIITVE